MEESALGVDGDDDVDADGEGLGAGAGVLEGAEMEDGPVGGLHLGDEEGGAAVGGDDPSAIRGLTATSGVGNSPVQNHGEGPVLALRRHRHHLGVDGV